jgi:hypothetical protein
MLQINDTCLSVKKKNSTIQCSHKRKPNKLFCGIHLRAKSVVRVDTLIDIYDVESYKSKLSQLEDNIECIKINNKTNNKISNKISNKDYIISKFVKIDNKKSKKYYYDLVIKYLIKIQSIIRMYDIKRRNKSKNKESCFTFDSIYNISTLHVYMYHDIKNDNYYCFDIRNLNKMVSESTNKINPYTNNKLSDEDINKIKEKVDILQKKKFDICLKKDKLTKKQQIRSEVINAFHKIDLLGNYTDINWFMDLNLSQLHNLYYQSYDIFYYRLPLTHNERKIYVKDGKVFLTPYASIKLIKNINDIRKIIINEYNKFLDFNTSESNKKTSCIWLLMALIEVSKPARDALQHLII